ncbi:hypothetical protein G1ANC_00538 [Candidatus Nanosynsacchari sp. TM7_ANC_38.39_G1_1]|nr:hypothetical protein G1ANC_00538 [Candidatus Nanosynsacchari sp. TM7_ANC_38.39_G1_1]
MNLVADHVVQLDHVHDTNSSTLLKGFAAAAVEELTLTIFGEASFLELFLNRFITDTVKWRRSDFVAESAGSHTQMCLEQLAQVHATRHA